MKYCKPEECQGCLMEQQFKDEDRKELEEQGLWDIIIHFCGKNQ